MDTKYRIPYGVDGGDAEGGGERELTRFVQEISNESQYKMARKRYCNVNKSIQKYRSMCCEFEKFRSNDEMLNAMNQTTKDQKQQQISPKRNQLFCRFYPNDV